MQWIAAITIITGASVVFVLNNLRVQFYIQQQRSTLLYIQCMYKSLKDNIAFNEGSAADSHHNVHLPLALPEETVVILSWTPYWNIANWLGSGSVAVTDSNGKQQSCYFTADRRLLHAAHYVVFHAVDICDWPEQRWPFQHWVLYSHESPIFYNYGQETMKFYRNLFNFSASYRLNSDFPQPYGRCWKNDQQLFSSKSVITNHPSVNIAKSKSKLVAWFVSDCITQGRREDYVNELKRFVNVDIFGKCGNLRCPTDQWSRCYEMLNQTYKFYLAFENSLCTDYVTEKVYGLLAQRINIIPIVYGHANYSLLLPPHSFIDAHAFATAKHLADYIRRLDEDDDLYMSYFQWRKDYTCILKQIDSEQFCQRSIELLHMKLPNIDVSSVFDKTGSCTEPEFS